MLNGDMGIKATRGGVPGLNVPAGRAGCALFGPYEEAPSSHIRVSFTIVPFTRPLDGDQIIAFVDVVGDSGQRFHAADVVFASQIADGQVVTLDADVEGAGPLEYRVHSSGAVPIFVADRPSVSPISAEALTPGRMTGRAEHLLEFALLRSARMEDLLPNCGPPPMEDEGALGAEWRSAWKPLAPHAVRGFAKERIGSTRDGGYVCVPDLEGIDTVLSFGINDNVDFDADMADRGVIIHQYDHTVDDPRPDDKRMIFHKKMIGVGRSAIIECLSDLIRDLDNGDKKPNIFLKIDIENWEWSVLDAIPVEELGRVRQITGEFHAFEFFRYPLWRDRMRRVLAKLADRFVLVHVHANNYAGRTTVDGMVLPNVLELSFVNRACYETAVSGEVFPTPLDMACNPDAPDYELGTFTF